MNTSSSDGSHTKSSGNGRPYDGKVYVAAGTCADGSSIQAQLQVVRSATMAAISRWNCADLTVPTEVPVSSLEFSADSQTVIYQGVTLTATTERLSIYCVSSTSDPGNAIFYTSSTGQVRTLIRVGGATPWALEFANISTDCFGSSCMYTGISPTKTEAFQMIGSGVAPDGGVIVTVNRYQGISLLQNGTQIAEAGGGSPVSLPGAPMLCY